MWGCWLGSRYKRYTLRNWLSQMILYYHVSSYGRHNETYRTSVSAGRSPVSTDRHVGRRESGECNDNDGESRWQESGEGESLGKAEREGDESLWKAMPDWEGVAGMAVKCLFVQYLINIVFVTKNHLKGPLNGWSGRHGGRKIHLKGLNRWSRLTCWTNERDRITWRVLTTGGQAYMVDSSGLLVCLT
jgi:hypothetical protein